MNVKLLAQVALLFCGAVFGAGLAGWLAEETLLRTGQADLKRYAGRVMHSREQIALETGRIIADVSDSHLDFCSDQELTLMRREVFNASYVKYLGRVRDGSLYCTTGMGRLSAPIHLKAPDFEIQGRKISPLVGMAFSNRTMGYAIEERGVFLVLNPDSFRNLFEPPKFFTGYLFDPSDHRLLRSFGNRVPLSKQEVLEQAMIEREGSFFQPLCSFTIDVCLVATESRHAMMDKNKTAISLALGCGALLGVALASILILLDRRQRSLERQLQRAVRKGSLSLVYQPIVDLETYTIVGAEALARWVNDAGESIKPDAFIAIAEEQGFINEITRFVLSRAVDELGDLMAKGNFRVTVNIAEQDLKDPQFFAHLSQCMSSAGIAASAIGIELTERSTANQEMSIRAITQLQRAGHTVYIDDFGTGYSSLAYLHQLAADAIKIDRTFTHTVCTDAVTASVVPQILDIARRLDLVVVVEGIETCEQATYFRQAGRGTLAQGFLFGAPMTAEELRVVLREQIESVGNQLPLASSKRTRDEFQWISE